MIITGSIQNVRFFADSGYTIAGFILSSKSFSSLTDITSKRLITIVGTFDRKLAEDEEFELTGEFVNNKKYGLQFNVSSFKRLELKNEASIVKYLSSDLFSGIGKTTAVKIVKKLGKDTINKIMNEDDALIGLGLSIKQIVSIKEGITKDLANQEALLYFLDGGLTIDVASKIINTLGPKSVEIVKDNPYILMDKIDRFGFIKNDKFALNKGIDNVSTIRIKALVAYVLKETIYNEGNSYVLFSKLLSLLEKYLEKEEISINKINLESILDELEKDKKIHLEYSEEEAEKLVFDYSLYNQEVFVSKYISSLIKNENDKINKYSEFEINREFEELKINKNINLSEKQKKAIITALTKEIMIITGGPGTGKTTIIKGILELNEKLSNHGKKCLEDVALLAPTGRAAKRLEETSGYNAMTIHRYLGFDGAHFTFNKDNKRTEKLIIVDEASMMDLPLFYQLVTALSPFARLIIVGDVDQLPSIGPGQILKDLIDTREIFVLKLDQIHRQAENSSIISLSRTINEGFIPENLLERRSDRSFIVSDNEFMVKHLVDIIKISLAKGYDIHKDLQILIPTYKSDLGIDNINTIIQNLVNPKIEDIKYQEYQHLNKTYRVNDKIIQLINRPEKGIMNGDIGIISSLNMVNEKIEGISATFDDVNVDYTLDELDEISLAYAVTIHKAQGSEFPVVILPISSYYYHMLKRKLIYTAITRSKEKLILLGDPNMLKLAASRIEVNRKTILKDLIKKLINEKNSFELPKFVFDKPIYEENNNNVINSILGEEEIDIL